MKIIVSLMLVGGLSFHSVATGESKNHCDKYPEVTRNAWPYFTDAQCDCGNNLSSKYQYKQPSGMTLVAVCDFRKDEFGEFGGFFFRGKIVTTEPATYVQGSLGGPRIHFNVWQFIERESAFNAFHVPALTETVLCWEAEATVEVTQLLVMEGQTDEAGEWPIKYRVTKVGNYSACDAEKY